MGKHNKETNKDEEANLAAAEMLRNKDFKGAAAVIATTSKENQKGFIKRVKRK